MDIYILECSSGEYDSRETWIDSVHPDRNSAERKGCKIKLEMSTIKNEDTFENSKAFNYNGSKVLKFRLAEE